MRSPFPGMNPYLEEEPDPPLRADEAEWAGALLREHGRR
jgi:hypothetical protein